MTVCLSLGLSCLLVLHLRGPGSAETPSLGHVVPGEPASLLGLRHVSGPQHRVSCKGQHGIRERGCGKFGVKLGKKLISPAHLVLAGQSPSLALGLHRGQRRALLSRDGERKWGLVKTRNFLTTPGYVPELLVPRSGMEIV